MIKCLIFDFDGILYDEKTAPIIEENFYRKLSIVEKFLNISHEKTLDLAHKLFSNFGSSWYAFERFFNIPIMQHGNDIDFSKLKENKNLNQLLKSIKIKKVIFSNAQRSYIDNAIQKLNMEGIFDEIFSHDSIKLPPKPNPEAFLYLLNKVNFQANECIFFDDSLRNLTTAKKLEINTVYCKSEIDMLDANCDKHVADFQIENLESGLINAINFFNNQNK